jgi:hypothetical protein
MLRPFETRRHPLLPFHKFLGRVAVALLIAGGILLVGLGLGVLGYHYAAGFAWIDALLNASMILTGMGPVGELHTVGAKIFASAYALFSGLVFITVMAVVLAPLFHRMMHKFHIDEKAE